MVKYFCDNCDTETKNIFQICLARREFIATAGVNGTLTICSQQKDLCENCLVKIRRILNEDQIK